MGVQEISDNLMCFGSLLISEIRQAGTTFVVVVIVVVIVIIVIVIIVIIIIIRVFYPRAGLSLQTQEPRLQFYQG